MLRITGVITRTKALGSEVVTIEASGEVPSHVASDYNTALRVLNPSIQDLANSLCEVINSTT